MAEKLPMLALSPTMEEGTIVKWIKNVGESVEQSEVLCEVETDKATMEYESPEEGTLLKIIVEEGGSAKVGDAIAVVGEEGEDVSDFESEGAGDKSEESEEKESEESKESEEEAEAEHEKEQPSAKEQPKGEGKSEQQEAKAKQEKQGETKPKRAGKSGGGKVRSTPLARKLAESKGLDIADISGTGPEGRVTKDDVEEAAGTSGGKSRAKASDSEGKKSAAEEGDWEEAVSQKRKVIAERLSGSKFSAPHYYLKVSAVVDNLLLSRKKLNERVDNKISLNAFLIKFTAEALKRHPMVNSSWGGDKIIRHKSVDVALAVAIDDGLITPVVRNCGEKGILDIDSELKVLIEKSKTGSLKREQYSDSTFTITNLGSFGIEEFTAIINPPNSAILAVGKVIKEQVFDDSHKAKICDVMKLTLSCDHRLIDGAVGAKFLTDLKDIIEYPVLGLY